MSNKTPILTVNIRKGDTIRCEYGNSASPVAHEYVAIANEYSWDSTGTHYLLNRPVPPVVLPTEIGYQLASDGELWYRQSTGANNGYHWQDSNGERFTDEVARKFAPFTHLRAEAEVVAEVLRAVTKEYANTSTTSAQDHATIAAKYGVTL